MSFTFVTALYNISRERHDGRSYVQYQEWFKRTLTIPVPMVIYTEKCNEHLVNTYRRALPTKVIYTTIDEVPFYYTKDQVKNIITNSPFKYRIQHPNGLENRCFEYIPVINSKFVWMADAIKENHFGTDMYFWIDAGLSRFLDFDIADRQFNHQLIADIHSGDKIYIQEGKKHEFNMVLNGNTSLHDAVGKNINFMMAGFWGGNRDIILEICQKGAEMYIEEFIQKEQVDNEQVLFGFILKKYIDRMLLVPNTSYTDYINYYIFCGR